MERRDHAGRPAWHKLKAELQSHSDKITQNLGLVIACVASLAAVWTGYEAGKARVDADRNGRESIEQQKASVTAQIQAMQIGVRPFIKFGDVSYDTHFMGDDLYVRINVSVEGQTPALHAVVYRKGDFMITRDSGLRILGTALLLSVAAVLLSSASSLRAQQTDFGVRPSPCHLPPGMTDLIEGVHRSFELRLDSYASCSIPVDARGDEDLIVGLSPHFKADSKCAEMAEFAAVATALDADTLSNHYLWRTLLNDSGWTAYIDSIDHRGFVPAADQNRTVRFFLQPGPHLLVISPSEKAHCILRSAQSYTMSLELTKRRDSPVRATGKGYSLPQRYAHRALNISSRSAVLISAAVPAGENAKNFINLYIEKAAVHMWLPVRTLARHASGETAEFYFVLEKGRYRVRFATPPGHNIVTYHVIKTKYPLQASLQPLSEWLAALMPERPIGIADVYEESVPPPNRPAWVIDAYREILADINAQIAAEAISTAGEELSFLDHRGEHLLLMDTHADREVMRAVEEDYSAKTGAPFWGHVLRKAALGLSESPRRVVADSDTECAPSSVYVDYDSTVTRHGFMCERGSTVVHVSLPSTALASSGSVTISAVRLPQLVRDFLPSFLPRSALIDDQQHSDQAVDFIVRNIRGQVVVGGHAWEKVSIGLVLAPTTSKQAELHVYVDGLLSYGMGGYPPDSQFTTSMEAQYGQSLTEYANRFASAFQAYLETRR